MDRAALAVFWINVVLIFASFGGAFHGLFDSLAVFRIWWAIGVSLSAVFLLIRRRRFALSAIMILGLILTPFWDGILAHSGPDKPTYSLYQKNLLFNGTDPQGILRDIAALSPDFVTLEEVSRDNQPMFEALAIDFRSSLLCRFAGVGGVAVLSKWPLAAGGQKCAGERGLAAMQVVTPAGPVWLVSLHLHWPFPYRQREQMARLLPEIEALSGPVLIAGDFNMVPWSYTLRAVAAASGSKRAGPVLRTYAHELVPLRLPIDHILVPGGVGDLSLRPQLGSDHFGLLLKFNL